MWRIALLVSLLLIGCSKATPDDRIVTGDVSIAYLKSMADIRSSRVKSDIWIEGVVALNDKQGESYKSFVVYDGTAGVEVKVDMESVDEYIPLLSTVRIRCEGLYLGREGERIVLGAKPTGEYTVDRLSEEELYNYLAPSIETISKHKARRCTPREIGYDDMLCYIRVDSVWVVAEQRDMMWGDEDAADRLYDSSLRYFTDGSDTITVATLNMCHYIDERLPNDRVTLYGVVDGYQHNLVLRINDYAQ